MTCVRERVRFFTAAFVFAFIWVMASPWAWSQGLEQLTINYIEAVPVSDQFINRVDAYVTVSDRNQRPVPGLGAENFKVLEDGRPAVISSVAKTTDPMAVVLAIDTSGSMLARDKSGETSMAAAKRAAIQFISRLGEQDRVALYSFNTEPILCFDFSSDRKAAVDAVNALKARVNAATCLYDTAFEAVKKSAEIPRGRRAIVLLTDGKDEKGGGPCSTYHVNDVIDAATTKTIRVPIYTIGVGPKVDPKDLDRIASFTGGISLLAATLEELDGFYRQIADQLKNQYLVRYRTQSPSGEHSLVIKALREDRIVQDEKRFWAPPLPVLPPPSVHIVHPGPGDALKDAVTVKIKVVPEKTVASVRYYVDAVLKAEFTGEPFDTFGWNVAELAPGGHVLRVEAVDVKGQSGSAEITHLVAAPLPPKPESKPPPSVAVPISPTPQPPERGSASWIFTILLPILVATGLLLWWLFGTRRKKADLRRVSQIEALSLETPGAECEDEDATIFVTGAETAEKTQLSGEIRPPIASLTVVQSDKLPSDQQYDIGGTVSIGRGTGNNINIPDKSVSRKHAEIYLDGRMYYIRDLGSKYGVKVNGDSIPPGRTGLKDGDRIQLGPKTVLQIHLSFPPDEYAADDLTRKYDFDEDRTLVVD